jgi:hypothetical protein
MSYFKETFGKEPAFRQGKSFTFHFPGPASLLVGDRITGRFGKPIALLLACVFVSPAAGYGRR